MQCHATSKRHQRQCHNPAMRGLTVCRMHGGKTPRGPASVHFKDGRYSQFLPACFFDAYERAANDPKLLELRRDIALVDARMIDILKQVDTGESGAMWREAQAAMARFTRAQTQGDIEAMQRALAQVQRLITRGAADYAAWGEIGALIEQRRKLCESEQRRVTMAHEILTVEQAMFLLRQVVATIQRHVTDRQALSAIALELQALGHAGNGHTPPDDAALNE